MKHHLLPENNTFDVRIHVLAGKAEAINRWFRRNYNDREAEDPFKSGVVGIYRHFEPKNQKKHSEHFVCVALDRCINKTERRDTLLHETVHCAAQIVEDKGMHVATNDEPLAYLVEWIFKNALPVVWKA